MDRSSPLPPPSPPSLSPFSESFPAAARGCRMPRGARGMAVVLRDDADGVDRAAELLRDGGLVAFPTETVYGLGANALLEPSVLRIFEVKGRPLTDPLIVHVTTATKALELVSLEGRARAVFEALAAEFWPGALTIVCPAREHLPACLGAGTGTVGIRCPSHPLARRLLEKAGVPVAAPSANRFGHTSPTRAQHVLDDLGSSDIAVLDGGAAVCENGIESTVCRILEAERKLLVYRAGAVTPPALRRALDGSGCKDFAIEMVVKHAPMEAKGGEDGGGQEEKLVAPGQLVTHYAPDLPTFLVCHGARPAKRQRASPSAQLPEGVGAAGAVVLDVNGELRDLRAHAKRYVDLSEGAGEGERRSPCQIAASRVFEALRMAETVDGATCVLLPQLPEAPEGSDAYDEYQIALSDRMFRAASGRAVSLDVLTPP